MRRAFRIAALALLASLVLAPGAGAEEPPSPGATPVEDSMSDDALRVLREQWTTFVWMGVAAVVFGGALWFGGPAGMAVVVGTVFLGFGLVFTSYSGRVDIRCTRAGPGTADCEIRSMLFSWEKESVSLQGIRDPRIESHGIQTQATRPTGTPTHGVASSPTSRSSTDLVHEVVVQTSAGETGVLPYATGDREDVERLRGALEGFLAGDAPSMTHQAVPAPGRWLAGTLLGLAIPFLAGGVFGVRRHRRDVGEARERRRASGA